MINRNKILLKLYNSIGRNYFLNTFVLFFYKYIIFNIVKTYLKLISSDLVLIEYRNSMTTPEHFNAFLSDIDIDLVIKDGSDYKEILQDYLELKSIFIMLDSPEIYYESEYKKLLDIKKDHNDIIKLSWNIRKINWSLDILEKPIDEIEKIKRLKSIKKSFSLILKNKTLSQNNIYNIEEFKTFDQFIPQDDRPKNLCYWSFYLETNKDNHLQILLTDFQYIYLHSLMPGEDIPSLIFNQVNQKFKESKAALEYYELLIAKSSQRLLSAQSKDTTEKMKWITYLEARNK